METDLKVDRVVQADCIEWMHKQPRPFADLVFADPPFNIGYRYDVYEDRRAYQDYYDWTRRWMTACRDILKPTGTFWIAIGDEYAAEVRMIGRELDLTLRNWVIWHYTFGQNAKRKFSRSHAHLFYFVRDPAEFTFEDQAVRVFSDRQRQYHDRRANPEGRIPDDTWAEFPRVCGTYREREGWHPCQMPESVLLRILRACSRIGDLVFDPFAGSGTTLAAARRLSRRYLGTELSAAYVRGIRERLARTARLADWPAAPPGQPWPAEHLRELQTLYMEESIRLDLLEKYPHLREAFAAHFNHRLASAGVRGRYETDTVWETLDALRWAGDLPYIKIHSVPPRNIRDEPAARPVAAKRRTRRPAQSTGGLFS